jgi:uncharacterized membrane protein
MNVEIHNEEGQTLVFVALCLLILMSFTALAVDVGMMFNMQRKAQTAADAAAVAAAIDLAYNPNPQTNRVADDAAGPDFTVQVTKDYSDASYKSVGANSYVEVVVTHRTPTVFMGFFRIPYIDVRARAVAGKYVVPNSKPILIKTGIVE